MSNTNSRNLRDVADDSANDQSDPNQSLVLGSDAIVGNTGGNNNNKQNRQQDSQNTNDDDQIPEEYRGKSPAELAKMLKDKEQMIGRQANELGHLRDLSTQMMSQQVSRSAQVADSGSSQEETVQLSTDDILDNPTEAIQRAVAPMLSKAVSEMREAVEGVTATSAASQFEKEHPTYKTDMEDPEFQKYVQNSRYRTGLASKALQQQDFDAADELWTGWEEHRAAQKALEESSSEGEQNNTTTQNLNDAVTVRGGGSDGAHASHKPIYSAVKLQELRNRNPDEYYNPEFQKELLTAYRENRVR